MRCDRQAAALRTERGTWESYWQELADFFVPRRIRLNTANVNRGDKRNQKIIDEEGRFAARTLQAGMMGGITSPARPWFRLTTPDPALAEFGPVKRWLFHVTNRIHWLFLRSNFYNGLPLVYGDLGVFGTASLMLDEDDEDILRVYSHPIGSYWLGNDERQMANHWGRDVSMTVRQIVNKFGDKDAPPSRRWENFSTTVRNAWDRGDFETRLDVTHQIYPNEMWDEQYFEAKYKRFASVYYEKNTPLGEDKFLRESGYDAFPLLCPRWELLGEDVWGSSPGMDALGSNKALQTYEKRIAQAVEKTVSPPLQGPTALRNHKISQLPGDVTFVDVREGQQGLKPIHDFKFEIDKAELKTTQIRQRIQRAFYVDLFLMMIASDRREITAREVQERHEEKLIMLGPVLERLNDELLDPAIDDAFAKLGRRGHIPPPPKELQGVDLRVEYVSLMAQAQKLVGVSAVERFTGFVGQLAGAQAAAGAPPDALDKLDVDQAIDEYSDIVGVMPQIVRPDEEVAALRQQRAQAQAQAMAAQNAQAMAGAAKDLSQADVSGDNALTRMLGAAAPAGL